MKIQILGSLKENGTTFYLGRTGEGNTVEFSLLQDTSPEVVKEIQKAKKNNATMNIDVVDIDIFRKFTKGA